MQATKEYIREALAGRYEAGEIASLTGLLLERLCGIPRYRQALVPPLGQTGGQACAEQSLRQTGGQPSGQAGGEEALSGAVLNEAHRDALEGSVERLRELEPIQYILGEADFCGLSLRVNPSVLIPRGETEELVGLIVEDCGGAGRLRLWDVGTGSGCIAVALGRMLPSAEIIATDNSASALETAMGNALRHGVAITFCLSDMLAGDEGVAGDFDIIVSNPPYVMESEREGMSANVLAYEPAGALFVPDDDPLVYYRALAGLCGRRLRKGGRLYLEINARLGSAVVRLLESAGLREVTLLRDLWGRERFIRCRR